MIPSRVTRDRVDTQIPWMLMRSTLSRLAKEKGHRFRVMGVLSAVGHIFNETAMHARAQASNRLARANRASHCPRVRAKEREGRVWANPKEHPKVPKVLNVRTRVKPRKLVYPVLKTRNHRQVQKLRNEHRRIPLTTLSFMMAGVVMNGMMAGVMMHGMMIGVRLDGTKFVTKRVTNPQSHFHLEVLISVPGAVRRGLNG